MTHSDFNAIQIIDNVISVRRQGKHSIKVNEVRITDDGFVNLVTTVRELIESLIVSKGSWKNNNNQYLMTLVTESMKVVKGYKFLTIDDKKRLIMLIIDKIVEKEIASSDINEEIKNSGVDLRFDIKIQHRFDAVDTQGIGVSYFYISREGPDKSLQKNYLGPFANTSDKAPDTFGSIGTYQVQTLNISRIITNDQFEIGDTFFISAIGDPNENTSNTDFHTVNSEQTYWVISDASKNVDDWNQEIE